MQPKEAIEHILYHRLSEIGYNDKEDIIVEYCLDAVPGLENEYEWEELDED